MDTAYRLHLRVAFVSTRDLSERNGRTPIQSHILHTLRRTHAVDVVRLGSVMELRRFGEFAGAILCWLKSLARGRPLPLQCLLYAAPGECARVVGQIRQFGCDAVYLDTVRCQVLLRGLRRALPDLYVVTDFDDLMSRRAAYLSRNRLPFLAGHVGRHFPRWLRYLIEAPLARAVTAYEAATLPKAEDEVAATSNGIVLLSIIEREMLERRLAPDVTLLHAVPPLFAICAQPWPVSAPLRFIFIGSDDQLQNRTAIDLLLRLWGTLMPATELHVYGRQNRPAADVPGVRWHGFVEDLAQVYQPGSIALVPALVSGGIKTKVAEAWAWGCPVLGNGPAFEGLAITNYPLALPESAWPPYLSEPAAYVEMWAHAARIGHAFVGQSLSPRTFEHAWERVMHPALASVESFALLAPTMALPEAGPAL